MPFALAGGGLEPIGFSNSYNGGYADRMRLTAGMCLKVPNGLDAASRRADRADGGRPARGEQVGDQARRRRARARLRPGRARGDRRAEVAGHRADRRRATSRRAAGRSRRRWARTWWSSPPTESAIDAWTRVGGRACRSCCSRRSACPGIIDRRCATRRRRAASSSSVSAWRPITMLPLVGIVKELSLQFALRLRPGGVRGHAAQHRRGRAST